MNRRIGKTSPLFAKRVDNGRYVKSGAGEREAPRRAHLAGTGWRLAVVVVVPVVDLPLAGPVHLVELHLALVEEVVEALGGRSFTIDDADRATYHAAAVLASNHLVALLGQVERVAGPLGIPLDAFLDLAEGSLANVRALGPADALTGPAARGDEATIDRHLAALSADERAAYKALADLARRLAGRCRP